MKYRPPTVCWSRCQLFLVLTLLAASAGCDEDEGRKYVRPVPKQLTKLEYLRIDAEKKGQAKEQDELGMLYSTGTGGVEQSDLDAIKWFKAAADQGLANAQYHLGMKYADARSVMQSDVEAVKWFRMAAAQEWTDAQYQLGLMSLTGRGTKEENFEEAIRWFRKAAEKGHAADRGHIAAQLQLGNMAYTGQGAAQDYAEAFKWYSGAAAQGDLNAQRLLGHMHSKGQGITKNYTEAAKWYLLAAEQGDDQAQLALGSLYTFGYGVRQDFVEGYKFYLLAATRESGSSDVRRDAKKFATEVKAQLTVGEVAEGQRRAALFLPKKPEPMPPGK